MVKRIYRYPTFDPQEEAYEHDPYIACRQVDGVDPAPDNTDDIAGINSPWTINCNAGRLVFKVNQLGGGCVMYHTMDGSPNLCSIGFGRGTFNSAMHILSRQAYNPQLAGYTRESGPEVFVEEVQSGPGKGIWVHKFKVPQLENTRGVFSHSVDLARHDGGHIPDPDNPGKTIEQMQGSITLLNTDDATGDAVQWEETVDGRWVVWGTWDGATAKLQTSVDGIGSWSDVVGAVATADAIMTVTVAEDLFVRVEITGAGANTELSSELVIEDLIDEDAQVPPWTQKDEVMTAFDAAIHYRKLSLGAGLSCIQVRWYYALARPFKAENQFVFDPDKNVQISGQVRPFLSGSDDISGIQMGSGMRIMDEVDPDLPFTHYALDESDVNGDAIMIPLTDYGDTPDEDRIRHAFWSLGDLYDPDYLTIKDFVGGGDIPPKMNEDPMDPEYPDHTNNGTGGLGSISITILACSDDPNDDRAMAIMIPRSPMTRMPVEGWNVVTGELMYRDNRRVYTAHQAFKDGGGDHHNAATHAQTRYSGLFGKVDTGDFANVMELIYQERLFIRGSPNRILAAAREYDALVSTYEDRLEVGDTAYPLPLC